MQTEREAFRELRKELEIVLLDAEHLTQRIRRLSERTTLAVAAAAVAREEAAHD